ncbi:hypothetical protein ABZY16_39495 [Streptomyces sp. NPDC006553]
MTDNISLAADILTIASVILNAALEVLRARREARQTEPRKDTSG